MKMLFALAAMAMMLPAAAFAQGEIKMVQDVRVQKTVIDPDGKTKIVFEEAKVLVPGDRMVFRHSYTNVSAAPVANFGMENPMPAQLAFVESQNPGATVSIDGGKAWGALAALTVKLPDGTARPAIAADVTHVRWALAKAIPPGGKGEFSFVGVVR